MGKRLNKSKDYDGSTMLENTKHELFCKIYSTNTLPKFWGNGQNSYEFAFGHTKRIETLEHLATLPPQKRKRKTLASIATEIRNIRAVCAASAARLLISENIKARCNWLLDQLGAYNIVDRELLYTIQQRKNLEAKVSAITHHDKREQRIRDKVDIQHTFEPIKVINITAPSQK